VWIVASSFYASLVKLWVQVFKLEGNGQSIFTKNCYLSNHVFGEGFFEGRLSKLGWTWRAHSVNSQPDDDNI